MEDIKLQKHFTFLIYPFLHTLTDKDGIDCPNQLLASWKLRLPSLPETATAIDDTFFFLPYVRRIIFPETVLLKDARPGVKFEKWTEEIKAWDTACTKDFRAFRAPLNPNALLWLRLSTARLKPLEKFTVVYHHEMNGHVDHQEIAAQLDYLEAMLFPTGLGLLILKVELADAAAGFSQLIDLNYYLRMVHAPTLSWIMPTLKFDGVGADSKQQPDNPSVRDLMDFLLQGMVGETRKLETDLAEFVARLQTSASAPRYTETEAGQVYGERCHLLSFACMDARQAGSATGAFDTVEDRLLYEFATCTVLGESVEKSESAPSPAEAMKLMADNRIFVWQCWRGLALKDNVVFLGTEDIAFNNDALPHNIENDYLPLYLYSLYQKYQLFVFAEELVGKVADIQANLRELRKLADKFLSFRNKYWFNEITRKPMGNELYRKFHTGLETQSLYDLVNDEMRQMNEHYESKNEKHISVLINFLTFVFLPLGAIIGAFGMSFFQAGSWKSFGITCAVVAAISFILWWAWNRWRSK